ncbi:DUF3618 domain-containing protein [Sphingomonas sp. ac-8]|uniref:DUF3618 domain-containing protein n=1 Tax=Sphingomonas sp. ac-8 TaxID=3242977 RepID=UPI003A7FC391
MTEPQGVAAARANAQQAKARMLGTVEVLKSRLSPSSVAENVVGEVKARASAAMDQGARVVKRQPGTVALGAGGFLALLLTPKLIGSLRRRCRHKKASAKVPATVAAPQPSMPPSESL